MAKDYYGSVDRVLRSTGVSPRDLGLDDESNPEEALGTAIEDFLVQVTSEIDIRLPQGHIDENEDARAGIDGLAERKVGDLLAHSKQHRSSPVVQIDEFTAEVINSSDVFRNLDDELEPYKDESPADDGSGEGSSVEVMTSITNEDRTHG